MRTTIRKIGNSSGIIINKVMLDALRIEEKDELELSIQEGKIIISKAKEPRKNWKEQFLNAGSANDESLEMDFQNEFDDKEWTW